MATWDWDVKTGEVVVNRRWPDMGVVGSNDLSWSADHWISIVHPDDWPESNKGCPTTLKAVQPSSNRNIGSEQGLTAGSGFSHAERSSTGTSTAGRCEWLEPRSTSLAENSSTTSEAFLADVATILSSSLEHQRTLTDVAQLATRSFADYVVVDLVEELGESRWLKAVGEIHRRRGSATS